MRLDGVGRLHQQVYRALLGEILGGRLTAGERVPSTRDVAGLLKVSRNTALLAYEQLLAEGFIIPRSGAAGTAVAPVLPPDGYVARPTRRPRSTRPGRLGAAPTLAAVGDRYVKSARACADSLALPSLTWELTPPTIRFDFRPGRASFGDPPYALWRRLLNARARDAKVTDLEYGPPAGPSVASAGLHLLVWLRGRRGSLIRDVHASAERVGVGLYTVDPFYATPPKRTGILLGFAPLMPADIREGIRRLAGALK